jgi:hypothetical protein
MFGEAGTSGALGQSWRVGGTEVEGGGWAGPTCSGNLPLTLHLVPSSSIHYQCPSYH